MTELKKGKILSLQAGNYFTLVDNSILKCKARGLFRHQKVKLYVGDYVMVDVQDYNEGYIVEVLERFNYLIRPSIANVDQALLITSYKEPNYSFNLINKFLAILEFFEIKPIIVVTKIDLANSIETIKDDFKDYYQSNYDIVLTSATNKEGIDKIKALLKDKVSVLIGQSGAGKSSLLNEIDSKLNITTNAISKVLNRGKHTTTHVEIYQTEYGMIADSPGFSSLSLDQLMPIDLANSYHDFKDASKYCKFNDCLHENEIKCEVKRLVNDNVIPKSRYNDYLLFLEEIKNRKVRY